MSENCKTQPAKEQDSVQNPPSDVIELNVGGQVYYTRHGTLTSFPNSLLGKLFSNKKGSSNDLSRDLRGRYFIDRDGFLFRYVLDYLRDKQVVLPDHFPERGRLKREAEYFQLPDLAKLLSSDESKLFPDDLYCSDFDDASQGSDQRFYPPYSLDRRYGYITVAFKGVCAAGGRENQTDSKAKKSPRIFISSRIGLAKEVFGDALYENRDTDRPPDRYTCRFSLKFRHLERAFDMLSESGFHIVACNSSLTASSVGHYADDRVWSNYALYIFYREWWFITSTFRSDVRSDASLTGGFDFQRSCKHQPSYTETTPSGHWKCHTLPNIITPSLYRIISMLLALGCLCHWMAYGVYRYSFP